MAQRAEVIIVGGGIWGLSTAFHLARLGQENVWVVERNHQLAAETTPQAAGLVGQIRSKPIMMRAVQYALSLFSELTNEMGLDLGLRRTGSLMIALTDERMEAYKTSVEQARQNDIDAHFISHAEMERLVPTLDTTEVKGGYFIAQDGYVDPAKCARAYGALAQDAGVQMKLGLNVTAIRTRDGRVVGIETEQGPIEAGHVIITAGPWGRTFANRMGFAAAVQPIRHQRVRTGPVPGIPAYHPVVRVPDLSCYLRPEKGAYTYGFFEPNPASIDAEALAGDLRTQDIEPPVETMQEAQARLARLFPILRDLEVAHYHQGITSFAPDGAYLIGPAPGVQNLFLATGCAALGIAGSAAIGHWLAKWICEGHPGEDLSLFALDRFGDRAANVPWVRDQAKQFYANYYSIRSDH